MIHDESLLAILAVHLLTHSIGILFEALAYCDYHSQEFLKYLPAFPEYS